ncbi:MAG: DUF308 domain-containing protein [Prevotella sp.]|nr:DUF308 domain-containing protein [Prevotella sp.]MCM1075565.1 DUF308 domain-containing protein [Ruminococcus sp.]
MGTISELKGRLHRLWWIPLLTGLLSIALGVWCFCSPQTSLPIFAICFSVILVVAGVLNLSYALTNRAVNTNWGWSLALGILELICGIWLYCMPTFQLTAVFVYAVGFWLIFAAINSISESLTLARFGWGWSVFMVILLVVTIIFGFFFITDPLFGMEAGWLWIGISFITFGIYRLSLAFMLNSINTKVKE